MARITLFKMDAAKIRTCIFNLVLLLIAGTPVKAEDNDIRFMGGATSEASADPFNKESIAANDDARVLVLTENFTEAVTAYARLAKESKDDIQLNCEYAYALALAGLHDASLARLDRVWNGISSNPIVNYYAAQLLLLMGRENLSGELLKQVSVQPPAWLASKAPALAEKYKLKNVTPAATGRDELISGFRRANQLAARGALLESLALFDEITSHYPGEYLPFIGYSIALEKAGMMQKSIGAMEKAVTLAGSGKVPDEQKQMIEKRLAALRSKAASSGPETKPAPASVKRGDGNNGQALAYAGGMLAKNMVSLNTRLGYFVSGSGNLALDLGISSLSGTSVVNTGFSFYERYKSMVGGMGISGSFGNGSAVWYFKISPGFSFMNKSRTASWDIFLDMRKPFKQSYATSLSLSIGRSLYFGKRK